MTVSRSIVSALVAITVAAAGCASDDGSVALEGDEYVASMTTICDDTARRLDELPEPPEQISATNWAVEVERVLRAESTAADALVVAESIRSDHSTLVVTTGDLADRYGDLSRALASGADEVADITTDIAELTFGRDDVAGELGLDRCLRSAP